MGRTTATGTVTVPLYLAYRCSQCGNINYAKHMITESRDVSRHGTLHFKSTTQSMKEASLENAREAMGQRLTTIFEEAKEHKYRSAEFNSECSKCKNKEPWSKLRYTAIETILGFMTILAIVFLIAFLINKEYLGAICLVGGSGAILGLWSFIKHSLRSKTEKLISELPPDSLHILALSESELFELANQRFK